MVEKSDAVLRSRCIPSKPLGWRRSESVAKPWPPMRRKTQPHLSASQSGASPARTSVVPRASPEAGQIPRGKYDLSLQELLARSFPKLSGWLLPEAVSAQALQLPRDLPATGRQADLIVRVTYGPMRRTTSPDRERILIVEFQVQRDRGLHHAMLLRAALAHSLYQRRVKTLVLALTPQAVVPTEYVFGEGPHGNDLSHQVTVREVFRESAEAALATGIAELLPLVATMQPRDGNYAALLGRIVERIGSLSLNGEQQTLMLEQTAHLATLHLPRARVDGIVRTTLRRGPAMLNFRELPYAKSVYREGKAEGKSEGEARGRAAGKAESVLTILEARGVRVSKALRGKILACTDSALLDQWLRRAASAKSVLDVLGAN